jgi:hypothetical protein
MPLLCTDVACASATLTVWVWAWLHGFTAADDVLDALVPWGELHEVVAADELAAAHFDLPPSAAVPYSPAMLLAAVRRAGASAARLVLPVPGDLGVLAPDSGRPGSFGAEALRAGQAVVLTGADMGVVPQIVADGVVRWTVHRIVVAPDTAASQVSLSEAEHALRRVVRDAAATLSALDIARHRPEVRDQIADTLAARPRPPWPSGTPGRVLRVLESADEVMAILTAAAGDDGAAVSASEARARTQALRPLAAAVRAARLAAVAEAVRALTDDRAGRH